MLEENLHWCGKDRDWLERTAQANTLLPEEILLLVGNETEDYFLLKKESRHKGSSRCEVWNEANLCVSVHRGSSAGCRLLQQLAGAEVCRGYFGRHRQRHGAIRDEDLPSARQALAEGAELCDKMREG